MRFRHGYVNFFIGCLMLLTSCASIGVTRKSDIQFSSATGLKLDVYSLKKKTGPKPVLVFAHGGGWSSGKKSQYKFLGRRMAHKGITFVVIDYRLSAAANYKGMAMDVASALKWVKENIDEYDGDNSRIFVSGHSAGGHLAALVSTDNQYFDSLKISNPLRGTVLIDPFGLDMAAFLSDKNTDKEEAYYKTFSKDPKAWKAGSPIYHLHKGMPPFLLFVGGRTYDVIKKDCAAFQSGVKKYQPDIELITVMRKKHIPMILQFINSRNRAYGKIKSFMVK